MIRLLAVLTGVVLVVMLPAAADSWQTVPGQAVSDAAEAFARSQLGVPTAHSVRVVPPRRVPSGRLEMVARWMGDRPQGDIQGRRFIVPVALVVDGRPRETIGVMVEIGPPASIARRSAAPAPAASVGAPMIRRGDHLTVTCRSASRTLQIEVDGVARDGGGLGECIRVQLEHRTVEARVTGPQQAEVDL